jgi:hypothetical protein
VPAGWYPEPAGAPGTDRYGDGAAWTDSTRPAGAESSPWTSISPAGGSGPSAPTSGTGASGTDTGWSDAPGDRAGDPATADSNRAPGSPLGPQPIPPSYDPPPGWGYGDPAGPLGGVASPPYGYGAYPYGWSDAPSGVSAGTNGQAIASLVCAIVGLVLPFLVLNLLGVVLGHVALRRIRTRLQAGRGLAIAGLVIGYVGIAWSALVILGLLFAAALGSGTNHFG